MTVKKPTHLKHIGYTSSFKVSLPAHKGGTIRACAEGRQAFVEGVIWPKVRLSLSTIVLGRHFPGRASPPGMW